MNPSESTITALLETGDAGAAALGGPGARALTFGELRSLVSQTVEALAARGIGPNDRVAIVLDNGPEMAVAFLSVASGATAAPLNPRYRAEEFEFYLTDLKAKLLIVAQGRSSPAIDVAAKLGIPVCQLTAQPERGAGSFVLEFADQPAVRGGGGGGGGKPRAATPDDAALVLHTSGTTSRPKIVPLLQRNLGASAGHICATLGFSGDDHGLCIIALFRIHGLLA